MIELSDWFNNPSLIEFGSIKIQYYAISWLLSAVLIYFFLKRNKKKFAGISQNCSGNDKKVDTP